MYVCSCFGITEKQVKEHAEAGACTPRQIASVSKAGTDCGSCVRRIQGILGRGSCPRRELLEQGMPALTAEAEADAGRQVAERQVAERQVAERRVAGLREAA
ncbi:(2Fe-2S)-binding protein [Streptomyces formicae]|uniref:(2Fe-2S)-binding protein n=1 Tax=Streptomyces formicae TaxID=1616117 RepID=UPI001F57B77F|nr:(2Fe-2S)-binding protein [Streptomyces formicae]